MLSIVICGNHCYMSFDGNSKDVICSDVRDTSEIFLSLVQEFDFLTLDCLIFSSGPGSFTSMRVIGSIVKGLLVCNPNINIVSISTFLTLYTIIKNNLSYGLLAINTMRGDFFCMDFKNDILKNKRVCNIEDLASYDNILFDEKILNTAKNLAEAQIEVLSTDLAILNKILIQEGVEIDYGIEPNYKI